MQIARKLSAMIKREPNMKVFMTRNEDVFIPLKVRVAKARKQRADLFVSIHADAFTSRAARSSVFALSTKGATSSAAKFTRRRRMLRTKLAASARAATAISTTPCLI